MKKFLLLLFVLSGVLFADTSGSKYTLKSDNKTGLTVTGSRPLQGDLDFGGFNLDDCNVFNAIDVNIQRISSLPGNGFVVTSGGNGTLGTDANSYFTGETDPCFVLLGVPYTGAISDVNLGIYDFITTGTLGAGVSTLSGNAGNAAFTLLNLNNNVTPTTGQTGQTADLVFNLTQSYNSVSFLHKAAKISAYKVQDWFSDKPSEADVDSGLKFYTTKNGVSVTQLTINEEGLATFAGSLGAGAITGTSLNTHTIPGGTGTLALTSDLSSYAPLASPTFTGTVTLPAVTANGSITLAENVAIILDPSLSADTKYSGIVEIGTGGATIAIGDLISLHTDGEWYLVDGNIAAGSTGDARRKLGMAVSTSSNGNPVTVLLYGKIRHDTFADTLVIGNPVYVSETAGAVEVTQPTTANVVIRIIGFGNTANELFFCPSSDYITHT